MNSNRRALLVLATGLLCLPGLSSAADAPAGKLVLTVVQKASGARSDFDMAQLERLPQHSFTTSTPWYQDRKTFTGPLLRDVLAAAGAKGSKLRAISLNDYKVDLPTADAANQGVIVARLLDGAPMSVREKGPLFIVYPFDSADELRSEKYYSRSAWQLRTLELD
jgi:hypothetical protein